MGIKNFFGNETKKVQVAAKAASSISGDISSKYPRGTAIVSGLFALLKIVLVVLAVVFVIWWVYDATILYPQREEARIQAQQERQRIVEEADRQWRENSFRDY